MIYIYTDGGSRGNPGKSASAYIILNEKKEIIKKDSQYIGKTTNNVAEYAAIINSLRAAIELKEEEITLTSDSELIISQLTGKYRVKAEHLISYYNKVKELETRFKKIHYLHQERENKYITIADAMVNEVLDKS